MKLTMPEEIRDTIAKEGIIAVLEIESEKNAIPAAKALLEGGIVVIELLLRTPAAIPSISLIASEVPQMFISVCTIIENDKPLWLKRKKRFNMAFLRG
jgi:2-dehydro-3-deoxyphosphogluconate aldolase/(4S)-4-hydroxy-2-oxoglutarate aldolase